MWSKLSRTINLAPCTFRANIPYARDAQEDMSEQNWAEFAKSHKIRRHVGLYAFRVSGLRKFVELGPSLLSK